MSRRKPPVTTKAQREAMVDVPRQYGATQTVPTEGASASTGAPDINAMLKELIPKLSAQWDRKAVLAEIDRAAREASKPAKPPASGWRSMASAPTDGSSFLGVVAPYRVVRIGYICANGQHFRGDDGCLYRVAEMLAWAPIPEWRGEVSE